MLTTTSVLSKTDIPLPATVSASSEPSPSLLNPALIGSLNQLAPLVLTCVTLCLCLYLSVQLMEQFNRFIELVKKK